jgi:hypothetical protein
MECNICFVQVVERKCSDGVQQVISEHQAQFHEEIQ